ncbi:MAG: hypothetical protein J7454_16560 [Roseiflexus sp.]|jgi:hypothetical protein|nr:hypothetical protein [Roseiflexus sp.]
MSSLEIALRGDWLHWNGLEAGLTGQALRHLLGPDVIAEAREPARLSLQLVTRQVYRRTSPPHTVVAWFEDTSDRLLLIDLDEPPSLASLDDIVSAWGPADRVAPGRAIVFGAMTTEYVYLSRGIALTIAESYDDPPSFAPRIARVQLFAPTDLQGFLVRFGGGDQHYGPR